jgi:hypothetical protein
MLQFAPLDLRVQGRRRARRQTLARLPVARSIATALGNTERMRGWRVRQQRCHSPPFEALQRGFHVDRRCRYHDDVRHLAWMKHPRTSNAGINASVAFAHRDESTHARLRKGLQKTGQILQRSSVRSGTGDAPGWQGFDAQPLESAWGGMPSRSCVSVAASHWRSRAKSLGTRNPRESLSCAAWTSPTRKQPREGLDRTVWRAYDHMWDVGLE